MKKIILPILAASAFALLCACTTVEREPSSHTSSSTTTEQSRTISPVQSTTTETRRSY